MEEVLQIVRNRLRTDSSFPERSPLQVEDVMELLDICLKTTYFQFEDTFYQQKEGMAMGNSLSPVVSNIFMEHFEEIAIDTAEYKPAKWLRYVDDTFVIWPYGPEKLQEFLQHINNIRPTIKFTMEVEVNNALPFLDVLVMKQGPKLTTKVYRKPTHTGRYLHFKSNHPHHVKRGVVHSLVNRAKVICQDQKDFSKEIRNIRHDLMLSEYPKEFVDSVLKPSTRNRPSSDTTYRGTVVIPYVKGIAEKFRRIGNRFQLRTIFKTKHTLRETLMKTGPGRDAQKTKQCVYSIPCDCGRYYIGETSRPLEVRIKEHKYNMTQGLLEKSKLAQHAYEEDHKILWNEAKVLQIEHNTTYRKYKESAHMSLLDHPISQPSVEISPIWTPVITAEIKKLQRRQV